MVCLDRPFPLTPALSLREREQRSPRSADRNATALRALADFPPLPAGEGRGEGEGRGKLSNANGWTETELRPGIRPPRLPDFQSE